MDELHSIQQRLITSYNEIGGINHINGSNLPSKENVSVILDGLHRLLFPGYFQDIPIQQNHIPDFVAHETNSLLRLLTAEIAKSLASEDVLIGDQALVGTAQEISLSFLDCLPRLRHSLKKDIQAIYEGDPSSNSEDEIILAYTSFWAITVYRLAHELYILDVPLMPRMMTEISHMKTGIDIHPGAKIGEYFCIDHGSGLVIGETAVIGNHVKLYQGVTLGALSLKGRETQGVRHPKLEDYVTVYARTTILGGDTVVGEHSIIGGNVWLTSSVKPYSKIYLNANLQQRHIQQEPGDDPGDFS